MASTRPGILTAPLAGFLFLCVLWGSTWIAIRYGAITAGPVFIAFFRVALATVAFAPVVLVLRSRLPGGAAEWRVTAIMGVLLYAGNLGPVYWGLYAVPAGLGALIFATMPLQVTLFAHFLLKDEPFTARRVTGILVGIVGVYLLLQGVPGTGLRSFTLDQILATDPLRIVAVFLGGTGAALSTVLLRRETSKPDPVGMNFAANGLGALVLLPFVPLDGERFEMPLAPAPWIALLYLVILGSIVGFLVFYWLVKSWPANRVSLVNLITPITAVTLGIVILGEAFDPAMVLGGAVILVGVGLAITTSTTERRTPEASRGAGAAPSDPPAAK